MPRRRVQILDEAFLEREGAPAAERSRPPPAVLLGGSRRPTAGHGSSATISEMLAAKRRRPTRAGVAGGTRARG